MKKNISVFCAASNQISRADKKLAYDIGHAIGTSGNTLIFGAGSSGAMGNLYKGYMDSGPDLWPLGSTTDYIAHIEKPVPEGHIVTHKTMYKRNEIYWFGNVCVTLGGGSGTFAEFWEFLTSKRLKEWEGDIILIKESWITGLILSCIAEMKTRKTIGKNVDKRIKVLTMKQFKEYLNR